MRIQWESEGFGEFVKERQVISATEGIRRLDYRKAIGFLSRALSPGYGWCHRCGITWNWCESHSTQFTKHSGCFPLCEVCWSQLATPVARMPFYRQLYDEWEQMGCSDGDWDAIESAVLKEGDA